MYKLQFPKIKQIKNNSSKYKGTRAFIQGKPKIQLAFIII